MCANKRVPKKESEERQPTVNRAATWCIFGHVLRPVRDTCQHTSRRGSDRNEMRR